MTAEKYGRCTNVRAILTATGFVASRLKKYTPGLPPART